MNLPSIEGLPHAEQLQSLHALSLFNGDELFAGTKSGSVYSFLVTEEAPALALPRRAVEMTAYYNNETVAGVLRRYSNEEPISYTTGRPALSGYTVNEARPARLGVALMALGDSLYFLRSEQDDQQLYQPLLATSHVTSLTFLRGEQHLSFDEMVKRRQVGQLGLSSYVVAARTHIRPL